jgi:trimeric autotransporter adhesin
MKKIFLSFATLAIATLANAQVSITTLTYNQNFNALDTTVLPSANFPAGWSTFEYLGSGTSAAVDQMYSGRDGGFNGGNTYSFGSNGSTERALGSIASGSTRMKYGVGFTNNTGATITSLQISYVGEQWRIGHAPVFTDTLAFEYSAIATGINDTISSWMGNSGLSFISPITSAAAPAALDGNLPANKTIKTGTIYVSIPVGGTIYLRWTDVRLVGLGTGNGNDGLAVDDVAITFSTALVSKPILLSTNPADNANNVAFGSTNLSVTFDKPITLGTGNIFVINNTTFTPTIIAANSCTVAGNTVTIPNVLLTQASAYSVLFDSTCFTNAGFKCDGIYDPTSWNFNTLNPKPILVNRQPFDNSNNVPITVTNLYMRFDKPVVAGTGTVTFKNLTAASQVTFAVPSANVVISNDTVLVNGIVLAYGQSYAVLFDSACFLNSGYKSDGIYNDTLWNFNAEMAPPPPVATLNETFTGCTPPTVGGFRQFSNAGAATWRCSTFGRTDANAASINGANATTTNDNTDWLISPALDMSANPAPYLNFWTKTRFFGPTTKQVYVSNNYINGDPNAATWTLLPVTAGSDTNWVAKNNTSLAAYKATPFVIAFKYISTAAATSNAEEWAIDDINISNGPVAINNRSFANAELYVVNSNNVVKLVMNTSDAANYTVAILDVAGKVISTQNINTLIGRNIININTPTMANGMYLLQVSNASGKAVLKFTK